jgi:hypothetical protein
MVARRMHGWTCFQAYNVHDKRDHHTLLNEQSNFGFFFNPKKNPIFFSNRFFSIDLTTDHVRNLKRTSTLFPPGQRLRAQTKQGAPQRYSSVDELPLSS